MFTAEEQKKEIDGVGVCAGLERGWCIVWYATWLPLGLDLYSHRTREGGREEGRRGERGGFSRGRAKQGVLALAGLGRSDTCIQDGRSPGASRVIGIQGRGSKKRDDGKTGEKVEMKIHQRFPNPGHCRLRGGLSGGGGHQPWERAWALIAGQTPRTGSGGNNHGGRA